MKNLVNKTENSSSDGAPSQQKHKQAIAAIFVVIKVLVGPEILQEVMRLVLWGTYIKFLW